jgi:putative membrane protein
MAGGVPGSRKSDFFSRNLCSELASNQAETESCAALTDGDCRMQNKFALLAAATLLVASTAGLAQGNAPINDAQIAHIAYTAGVIDVAAGKQALTKSKNKAVRSFAEEMVRDHQAVNAKALALVKKLGVTPQDNPTSASLSKQARDESQSLSALNGAAFDRAYVANEVAFHRTVNGALKGTLIPGAKNAQLKSLLETGLALFSEHQQHAEHLAAGLR